MKVSSDCGTYYFILYLFFSSVDKWLWTRTDLINQSHIYFDFLVLPTNVSTYWEASPTIGHIVNITCRATYGNPPPYLRLYKDNIDITSMSYYYTENIRSSGEYDLNT